MYGRPKLVRYARRSPPVLVLAPAVSSNMPTVADEIATYAKWNWRWTAGQLPSAVTEPVSGYAVTAPDIHGGTEGDDLWTYLQQYARSGNTVFYNRAVAWESYFENNYLNSAEWTADNGFLLDHAYGWGLVLWDDIYTDAGALTAASNILNAVKAYWDAINPTPGTYPMAYFGARKSARHLLLATMVAEATGNAAHIALRDLLINCWVQSPDWNAAGMYMISEEQTGYVLYAGAWAEGVRAQSGFQIGVLTEAFIQAYRVTGNSGIYTKLLAMANFVDTHGVDPTYQYTGSWFGLKGSATWHNNSNTLPATFWDGIYTLSLANTLAIRYELTGERHYYDRAKHFFNRGSKSIYGAISTRASPDYVVNHFVDTKFDSSTENFYLAYNKGELQYAYKLFQAGGLGSALGTLAASMSVGQWSELTTIGAAAAVTSAGTGAQGSIFPYTDQAAWDPATETVYFIGGDHSYDQPPDGNPSYEKFISYTVKNNTWNNLGIASTPFNGRVGHNYNLTAQSPQGGIFYRMHFCCAPTLYRYDTIKQTWTARAALTAVYECYGGLQYGCNPGQVVMNYNNSIHRYTESTNSWATLATGLATGPYQNFSVYNPVLNIVLFGGGSGNFAVYKVNAAGTVTACASAPFELNVNGLSLVTVDPVSGLFLVFGGSNQFYTYNATTNVWAAQGGSPPIYNTISGKPPLWQVVAVPISSYGVVMFIRHEPPNANVYLYRHA